MYNARVKVFRALLWQPNLGAHFWGTRLQSLAKGNFMEKDCILCGSPIELNPRGYCRFCGLPLTDDLINSIRDWRLSQLDKYKLRSPSLDTSIDRLFAISGCQSRLEWVSRNQIDLLWRFQPDLIVSWRDSYFDGDLILLVTRIHEVSKELEGYKRLTWRMIEKQDWPSVFPFDGIYQLRPWLLVHKGGGNLASAIENKVRQLLEEKFEALTYVSKHRAGDWHLSPKSDSEYSDRNEPIIAEFALKYLDDDLTRVAQRCRKYCCPYGYFESLVLASIPLRDIVEFYGRGPGQLVTAMCKTGPWIPRRETDAFFWPRNFIHSMESSLISAMTSLLEDAFYKSKAPYTGPLPDVN